jgi:hypothetical protein
MPHPGPYETWCKQVLDRLEAFYPILDDDYIGDVVPREVVDPNVSISVAATEALVNTFLAGLNFRQNKFLSVPEEMSTSEYMESRRFVGAPYRFEIEVDRAARRVK